MTTNGSSTRDALLDAAESLFSERGYDAVGTREIAERAGANLASIKYHFGSKNELYLEAVRRRMKGTDAANGGPPSAWDVLRESLDAARTRADAAVALTRFTRTFLGQLLPERGVDPCGTLIIREGLQPSEALDDIVRDYLRPNQLMLIELFRVFLPRKPERDLANHGASLLGQILHYRVFRPIVERLRGEPIGRPEQLDALAGHIASVSLRGAGYDADAVRAAVRAGLKRQGTSQQVNKSTRERSDALVIPARAGIQNRGGRPRRTGFPPARE